MLWFSRPAPVPWSMHLSDPLTTLRKALTSRCRATEVQKPLIDTPAGHLVPYRELLDVFRKCEELTEEEQPRFRGLEQPTQEDLQRELSWLWEDAVAGVAQPATAGTPIGATQPPLWPTALRSAHKLEHSGLAQDNFALRIPVAEVLKLWRQRVQERVPLQYLVGASHWRDLVVAVGPGVLIPRPETEQIIDFVQEELQSSPNLAAAPWADLGCGSGALACALAKLLSHVTGGLRQGAPPTVLACDISPVAVAYTELNARRLGVDTIVDVRQGSWGEPLQLLQGSLAGIVSNPPYIPPTLMSTLQEEVRSHEPHLALTDGSASGMEALQAVAGCASTLLVPGGFFAVETHGQEQAQAVLQFLGEMQEGHGEALCPVFSDIVVHLDLFGVARFVTAKRHASGLETACS